MKKYWGLIFVVLLAMPVIFANEPPTQPTLTYPIGSEVLGERTNVTWLPSTDPDGDLVHYILEYSSNGGANWSVLGDNIGRVTRFDDNRTEAAFTFGVQPGLFSFALPKTMQLTVARLNLTGVGVLQSSSSWHAVTASQSIAPNLTRVWINVTGKIPRFPATVTQFVLGLDTAGNAPQDLFPLRVCTARNLTDSSCPQILYQGSANCNSPPYCTGDPDFNYALHFFTNFTLTSPGQVVMFETALVQNNGYNVDTLKRNAASVAGLRLGDISATPAFYPDALVRLEYAFLSHPSRITVDIGNDTVVEHTVAYELNQTNSPLLINLNKTALQAILDACPAPFLRQTCTIPVSINASEGTVVVNSLRMYFDVSAYLWLTQFFPVGTAYALRIKASDDQNESSYATSNTFSITYDPVECEQIPTTFCNITRNTTFFPDEYTVFGISIQNNDTFLDCNGATLISPKPQNAPNVALSVARQQNVVVSNCYFKKYHTGITSERLLAGPTSDLYPLPVYNITISNNIFEEIDYAPILLRYLNRTTRGTNPLSTIGTQLLINGNTINISATSGSAYFAVYIENFANAIVQNNNIFNDGQNRPYSVNSGYINLKNARAARVLFNHIRNGLRGISAYGVTRINETSGNTIIYGNNISSADEGIRLEGFNNIIVNNTLLRNAKGIVMASIALNNFMYANRMIDNNVQAVDDRNNTFDLLLMGNLWNDYMNNSQGCVDILPPFGRCDNPYVIDADSRDRFPLRQGVQFSPDGFPEPVFEVPPIITGITGTPVVIAGDPVMIVVHAVGITRLTGLQIVVDEVRGTATYVNPQNYGISDPVLQYSIGSSLFVHANNTFTWQTNASSTGSYAFTVVVSDGTTTKSQPVAVDVLPRGSMLVPSGSPNVGRTINFTLFDPLRANLTYVLAMSFGNASGIPLGDGRVIPLNYDPLFSLSVQYPSLIGLTNSVGTLDTQGRGRSQWTIPNVPQLAGVTVYVAFITLDATLPFPQLVTAISPALPIILQA